MKNVRVKPACCGGGEEVVDKRSLPFKAKLKLAFKAAWDSLRPIMGYLLIGVALGAAIYGYMPEDFVLKIAGPGQSLCRTGCSGFRRTALHPC